MLQNRPAAEWTNEWSFPKLSIYSGNDVQPPSPALITSSLRSESSKSTLHLNDVINFLCLSTTSLDPYQGTQLVDVDKDLAGTMA
jgi:hypothetical protein